MEYKSETPPTKLFYSTPPMLGFTPCVYILLFSFWFTSEMCYFKIGVQSSGYSGGFILINVKAQTELENPPGTLHLFINLLVMGTLILRL